jgi:hypothetical protein
MLTVELIKALRYAVEEGFITDKDAEQFIKNLLVTIQKGKSIEDA